MTASETPVPAGRSADRDAAWQQVRRNLKVAPGPRVFDQWLAPAVLVEGSEDDLVRIGLPSAFMTNYVRSHFADRLLHEFRALLPGVRRVTVETLDSSDDRARRSVDTAGVRDRAAPITAALASAIPAATGQRLRERHAFDPRLGFDRFVVDDSNRVAFNAARKLAEAGRPQFSPLYLHSPTGLGKTHLMHAIGQAFLATSPDASAIYMPAERFMFEFVQAMRARDTHAFKARLRSVDLLMIDDLQFIAGKDSTQEECFHTVNEFMTMGKRLVIACDRAPQALEGVESRLVSRLGAGLVADIRAPELSLRRAILAERLAAMPDVTVPEDVVDLLAARIASSIRELEGALNRLVAYAQLIGSAVTMDFAVATLGDMLRGAQRRITIDEIQKAVSAHFEVKQLDLLSDRRAVAIARPRQIAMYLAKRLTTRSLPEIGRKFGNRDHSTVIHAVKRIEDLRSRDHEIDGAVRTLMMQLEG